MNHLEAKNPVLDPVKAVEFVEFSPCVRLHAPAREVHRACVYGKNMQTRDTLTDSDRDSGWSPIHAGALDGREVGRD